MTGEQNAGSVIYTEDPTVVIKGDKNFRMQPRTTNITGYEYLFGRKWQQVSYLGSRQTEPISTIVMSSI